jgi:hypothetical protein
VKSEEIKKTRGIADEKGKEESGGKRKVKGE